MIDYADLIIMKSGNRLTAESEAVINGYLVKEADPTLLAMKAGAAFHAERYQVALAAWQQLLAMSDSGMGEGPVSGDPHAREQAEKGRRFLNRAWLWQNEKLLSKRKAKISKARCPLLLTLL